MNTCPSHTEWPQFVIPNTVLYVAGESITASSGFYVLFLLLILSPSFNFLVSDGTQLAFMSADLL